MIIHVHVNILQYECTRRMERWWLSILRIHLVFYQTMSGSHSYWLEEKKGNITDTRKKQEQSKLSH